MELERTCELFIKPWFFTLLSKLLLCILKDVYICIIICAEIIITT